MSDGGVCRTAPGTPGLLKLQPWLHKYYKCVACEKNGETQNKHFMRYKSYKSETVSAWNNIFGNDNEKQISAG